jgi:uncharacterized damage-inducible protein DinB
VSISGKDRVRAVVGCASPWIAASLQHKSDPVGNSLGKLAWHMGMMTAMTGSFVGLQVVAPPKGTEAPSSAAGIADAYRMAMQSFTDEASKKLKDEQLPSEAPSFGRTMPIRAVLNGLIRHRIHHRGQMTILMRQAGVVVPGVYGPSREETAAMRARQNDGLTSASAANGPTFANETRGVRPRHEPVSKHVTSTGFGLAVKERTTGLSTAPPCETR